MNAKSNASEPTRAPVSDEEYERIARAAGAAVRRPAPPHAVDDFHRALRRQRLVRASVAGVVAVVIGTGAVILARQRDPAVTNPIEPIESTTVAPVAIMPATTPLTTEPATTPPTTVSPSCLANASGVSAANALTLVQPTGLWMVVPQSATCLAQQGSVDSLRLEQRDLVTGDVLAARVVTMAAIHEVDGGDGTPQLGMYPGVPWGGLSLAGVTGRQVVLKTTTAVVGIDVDSGAMAAVALDDPNRRVGVAGSTILAVNAASVDRADLQTGTLETLATPGVGLPDFTVSDDGMWFCSTDPSQILRVAVDGSVHPLDQFVGTAMMCFLRPAAGSLWVVDQGRAVRLDTTDGHTLATSEERDTPPGNFIAFADADGYLALLGDWVSGGSSLSSIVANWWWVDNDGRITELVRPPGVTVLGVAGGQIVGYGLDYEIVSYAIADLMPPS